VGLRWINIEGIPSRYKNKVRILEKEYRDMESTISKKIA
jgi:hypothetical protein